MADDIDIEEHDVMENPLIKQIFPDLSILKKEILDYEDETQHGLNSIKKTKIASCLNRNSPKDKLSTTRRYSNLTNKIISSNKRRLQMDLISDVKISLLNVKPELLRSGKFCKKCLILFSKAEDFRKHQMLCDKDEDGDDTAIKPVHGVNPLKNNTNNIFNSNGIREENKTGDSKNNSDHSNFTRKCFHCSVVFSSQESLIDHLYEILNNKNGKLTHRNENEVIKKNYEMLQNEKDRLKRNIFKTDNIRTNNLYCCPICSYYFNVKKYYVGHLFIKHKLRKKCRIECVNFCSKCKFCNLKCNDVLSYNTHLRKCHRNEMIRTHSNESLPLNNKNNHKYPNKISRTKEIDNVNILAKKMTDVRILALKVVLYKCFQCNVHFITSDAAKNHSEHVYSLINWKCLKCQKRFKLEHRILHEKQHLYSNYFCVVRVNGAQDNIHKCSIGSSELENRRYRYYVKRNCYYYCAKCKCYILKNGSRKKHQFSCGRFKTTICNLCGLTLRVGLLNMHKKLHLDFGIKLQDLKFFDIRTNNEIKPILPNFPKCMSCETHFIYQHEVMHHDCEKHYALICKVCKIKLSALAYKLHEKFHLYKLNAIKNRTSKASNGTERNKTDSRIIKAINVNNGDKISYIYKCVNCDISMHHYDEVIDHCHAHNRLNKTEVDAVECKTCNVKLVRPSHEQHQKIHLNYTNIVFKFLSFDVLHFYSNREQWHDYLFNSLDKNTINGLIHNSIYRYENRIRMEIIQQGPPALTLFKCDKCQSYVNNNGVFKHIEGCRHGSVKFNCSFCNIQFANNVSKSEHENKHHGLQTNGFRILAFNRKKDEVINRNILRMKYYVLFQCRYCNVVIEDKNNYNIHKCNSIKCKNCNVCGLVINEGNYASHINKHKVFNCFNRKFIKVVLIGNRVVDIDDLKMNITPSKFTGMVCDYTFHRCVNCDVCVRSSTVSHYCLIDAAKSKCPQCGLTFDEGKIKGHLKLHETDPDITKDTIVIKEFGCKQIKKEELCANTNIESDADDCIIGEIVIPKVYARIYKCNCGLHFLNELDIKEHLKKCSGCIKAKHSTQDCFKCGLTFTQNVLFQHLLEHHGGKTVGFKYEMIEYFNNSVAKKS